MPILPVSCVHARLDDHSPTTLKFRVCCPALAVVARFVDACSPSSHPALHRLSSFEQFQNKFYALGHGDAVKFEPFSFALLKEAEAEAAA